MNKKHIFTIEELEKNNFGLFIIRYFDEDIKTNVGYAATVSYKLSYQHHRDFKYGLVNFLSDGWFNPVCKTKEELCEILNTDKHGYRLLTKEEVIYIINNRSQGFL